MKLFEIGDGLKSIKVTSDYYSDLEDEETTFLYKGEDNEPEIRISVISGVPKDETDTNYIYNSVIKEGEEKGYPVTIVEDKSYYTYSTENQEIVTHFYEIGYKCNIVIISVTDVLEKKDSSELQATLRDIESLISSITEISLKEPTIFEPKYPDFASINERISNIMEIEQDDIDDCHETDKTLSKIQDILDKKKYTPKQTLELQSLGLALGDYIQYKNENFHWAVVRDEYGRDLCLQYKNTSLTTFPLTMISKRVETGEEIVVDKFVNKLLDTIEDLAKKESFKELDHNY